MKYILELVLSAIVIFFVWNILKRIFFKTFYSYRFNNNNNQDNRQQDIHNSNKNNKQGLKWDAETVDYEEVKETKDKR
ncbi:hypothetical protein H3Z85_01670 [Chryseobacterium indologenes]|uniref:Uncharacterized protein n=1 Tax=Chryseobacterium indologenes TaxID=253 RepID=A0A1Z3W3B6_CHRID|nr:MULTISPECIES: hypothetical protein [Chryseobacterium]ASE62243.1 hypothetical protein CEQ15_12425 [Chryseobacterium indologenes]ATN06080.1 hypothetical protein CRN76_12030 [Chryseobacterium indologenes]AYY85160.1 hypothetical protein EGX91_11710 [Chryseobacterium indologenes]AYZ34832.1 hypothetical protein EGY07_04255 [Chryseobacterium indologenes]AZB17957.1 hypothetical protein EG352_09295 [Chryseobacterium indologenes]